MLRGLNRRIRRLWRGLTGGRRAGEVGICFVIAAPRSGTTWLKQALNAHQKVHCTENRFFGNYCDMVHDREGAEARVRITLDKYVEALMLHYNWQDGGSTQDEARREILAGLAGALVDLSARQSGKSIIVDKVTPYVGTSPIVADSITEFFPEAKIIELVRDGRDVLTSGVFHWLTKSTGDAGEGEIGRRRKLYFVENDRRAPLKRFFCDEDILEWCRTWTQPLEAAAQLGGRHSCLRIGYEEMIEDQAGVLARAFRFLEVEATDAVLRQCAEASSFEKMSGGRRRGQEVPTAHVRKGVVGDWRNYFTRRDGELFCRRAGDCLVRLGYEPDGRWAETLPESLNI